MWADWALEQLAAGRAVTIRPRGRSMEPKVRDGAAVTVAPSDPASLRKGDIVLVRVHGRVYLHQIAAADRDRVQIANNKGHINGWVARERVAGKAVQIVND